MPLSDRERLSLASNLTAARERKGWNLTYAAGRAGISISTLSQWENARRDPEVASLLLMAITYGCPMDDFLGGMRPGYDAIIEAPIPLDTRRLYEAKVDAVMSELAGSLKQLRVGIAPARTPTRDDDAPPTASGKSSQARVRRKRVRGK
jgi:transcriptional regulator with XRE-family HTH domain